MRLVDPHRERELPVGNARRAPRLEGSTRRRDAERDHADLLGLEPRQLGDLAPAELARGEDEARSGGARQRQLVERAPPEAEPARQPQRPHVVQGQHARAAGVERHEVERAVVDGGAELAQQLADPPQRGDAQRRQRALDPFDPRMAPDRGQIEAAAREPGAPQHGEVFRIGPGEQGLEQAVGVGADAGEMVVGEAQIVGDGHGSGAFAAWASHSRDAATASPQITHTKSRSR